MAIDFKTKVLVQFQTPITSHWVVIDKTHGRTMKCSRTTKPYKRIKIIEYDKNSSSFGY